MCNPLAIRNVHFLAKDSLKWKIFESMLLRGDLSSYDFQTSKQGYFFEIDAGEKWWSGSYILILYLTLTHYFSPASISEL